MAPYMGSIESNEISSPKKRARRANVDYSTPGSNGYNVPQDLTWNDPNNRKIRVLTIGAGISGILMAYQLQKHCENVEHVVYDKNEDVGGTWLENRYPRAGWFVNTAKYTHDCS